MGSDVAFMGSIQFPDGVGRASSTGHEPSVRRSLLAPNLDAACQWAHTSFDPRLGILTFEGHVERGLYQSAVRPEVFAILEDAARDGAEGEFFEVDLEGFGARIGLKDGRVQPETLRDDESWALWESERFRPLRARCERAADEAMAALGLE